MRFGSLFSGIGGFDLGLERAGMECAWQVEIDEYCLKVLAKHWPSVSRYTDVRECGRDNLEPVDLICGGFPCQPYSVAGKRRGAADDRNLWPEFLRIVRELRPAWIVGENVPGIVPMYLDTVLSDLEGEAYTCWTFNIPACAFDAPHRRERIFVVGYTESYLRGTSGDYRSKSSAGGDTLLAYANQECESGLPKRETAKITRSGIGGEDVCYATVEGLQDWINEEMGRSAEGEKILQSQRSDWWTVESGMGGTPNGFPRWMVRHIGRGMSYEESTRATETLQSLWNYDVSQTLWRVIGGFDRVQQAEILFAIMREYQGNTDEARLLLESKEALESKVRSLWEQQKITGSSHRSGHNKQRSGEHTDTMQTLSQLLSFDGQTDWQVSGWEDGIPRVTSGIENRVDRLRSLGNAVVPQVIEFIGRRIVEGLDAA